MKKTIVLLPGDGIGPEVTRAAAIVLREAGHDGWLFYDHHHHEDAVAQQRHAAIDAAGTPLPNATLDACRKADAVFLGAVGGPKWDALPVGKRPESGLLALRHGLGLYVNVRPIKLLEPLRWISPLKPERLGDLDIEIVRELAGGMYFGERGTTIDKGVERAFDVFRPAKPMLFLFEQEITQRQAFAADCVGKEFRLVGRHDLVLLPLEKDDRHCQSVGKVNG